MLAAPEPQLEVGDAVRGDLRGRHYANVDFSEGWRESHHREGSSFSMVTFAPAVTGYNCNLPIGSDGVDNYCTALVAATFAPLPVSPSFASLSESSSPIAQIGDELPQVNANDGDTWASGFIWGSPRARESPRAWGSPFSPQYCPQRQYRQRRRHHRRRRHLR